MKSIYTIAALTLASTFAMAAELPEPVPVTIINPSFEDYKIVTNDDGKEEQDHLTGWQQTGGWWARNKDAADGSWMCIYSKTLGANTYIWQDIEVNGKGVYVVSGSLQSCDTKKDGWPDATNYDGICFFLHIGDSENQNAINDIYDPGLAWIIKKDEETGYVTRSAAFYNDGTVKKSE